MIASTPQLLNRVFRLLMDGAELIALQHNRYWRRKDGLALDVGAYSAALEHATRRRGCRRRQARAGVLRARRSPTWASSRRVMVGDDVEADVGGAMAAGLPGVLVRTGKFRQRRARARQSRRRRSSTRSPIVPELLGRLPL